MTDKIKKGNLEDNEVSNEYEAWKKSFTDILDFLLRDRSKERYDENEIRDLLDKLLSNHLIKSVKLGVAYAKKD